MKSKRHSRPFFEVLEDRLTPAGVSYFYDGSNLRITGQTAAATYTLNETAANTLATPIGPFAVTGNLTVQLQEIGATGLNLTYNLHGNHVNGAVSLTASAFMPGSTTTVNVIGTAVGGGLATMGGPLSINVSNGNLDLVNVQGLTVGGVQVTDTLGTATVNVGTSANVNDNGNLFVSNANTVNLGIGAATFTATVQGLANISTRNTGGANALNMAQGSSVQGALIFTGAGNNTLNLAGTVFGALTAQLGTGANAVNFAATSVDVGNVTLIGGAGGTATTADAAAIFAGSVSAVMGNGTNTFTFNSTILGPTFSYTGGSGTDTVTYAAAAGAPRLNVNLGAGDDSFTLSSNAYSGGVINGGFGTNLFTATVTISPPLTILNF